jgi:5-(carboxyamino)imidazole ribonucleotide mutase
MAKKIVKAAVVGIIMGSKSDWPTMEQAAKMLEEFGVSYEAEVVSAHRTPDKMMQYAESAMKRGLSLIIAGAGGAAHLPGMVAAKTSIPVLGVPVKSSALDGLDSLLSVRLERRMLRCLRCRFWRLRTRCSLASWKSFAVRRPRQF